MIDYTKLDSADLIHALRDDADKWATAFVQHNPWARGQQDVLRSWFANAIECSHDFRTGRIHNGDHAKYLQQRSAP